MTAVTDLAAVKASLGRVQDPLLQKSLQDLGWLEKVIQTRKMEAGGN